MVAGSLYDSHGDVLVTKVHKPNSLEHLRSDRYGKRPSSAASSRSYTSTGARPPPSRSSSRPSSAYPRMKSAPSIASTTMSQKSSVQRLIDGESGGPPMVGVQSYPFSRLQYEYLEDFQALVVGTITHPYTTTSSKGTPGTSTPHDLLYGSNYDDDRMGGFEKKWKSEYGRSYGYKDYVQSKRAQSSGVRSEQFQFLG